MLICIGGIEPKFYIMSARIYFTKEQIEDITGSYMSGSTLSQIGERYSVSRATIQKVVKDKYPAYTGKKRASIAKENQTKTCSKCGKELPLDSFSRGNSLFGRRSYCKVCESLVGKDPLRLKRNRDARRLRRKNSEYVKHCREVDKRRLINNPHSTKLYLLRGAKTRARLKGLEFNIDVSDFELPECCPLLEIPLRINDRLHGSNLADSYSLDRIDPSKGYVKGNVWVISKRANVIKNDATLEELERIVINLKKHLLNNYGKV